MSFRYNLCKDADADERVDGIDEMRFHARFRSSSVITQTNAFGSMTVILLSLISRTLSCALFWNCVQIAVIELFDKSTTSRSLSVLIVETIPVRRLFWA